MTLLFSQALFLCNPTQRQQTTKVQKIPVTLSPAEIRYSHSITVGEADGNIKSSYPYTAITVTPRPALDLITQCAPEKTGAALSRPGVASCSRPFLFHQAAPVPHSATEDSAASWPNLAIPINR